MIHVRWIGHATVALEVHGVRLLTDPLIRPHAGLLRRAGHSPHHDQWAGTEAVLLSHLHLDHADVASLRQLPHVPVLTGRENAPWLRKCRFIARGLDDDEWTTLTSRHTHRSVEIRLVRADHHARPMPHRPNAAHGFLVRGGGRVVWFAGDTSVYDDMARLPELAGGPIDLALLPIHGWGPRLSEGHMGPEEAATACDLAHVRAVAAIHYGTFHPVGFHLASLDWMTRPRAQFAHAMAMTAPETTVVPIDVGQDVRLS